MQFEATVKELLEGYNVSGRTGAPPVPGDAGDTRQLGGAGGTGYIGNTLETITIDDRLLNKKKRLKLRRNKIRKRVS